MKRLTVFYDGQCGLCHTARQWLSDQRKFIALEFVAFQDPEAEAIFPDLASFNPSERLVVLSDEGGVYLGDQAWIMCLYALVEYRSWAQRLAKPGLQPMARCLCEMISANRLKFPGRVGLVKSEGS